MDVAAIFELITKGLGVISTAVAVGKNAAPAIEAIEALVKSAQGGSVTPEQLALTETSLDQLITDFNTPI